MAIHAGWYARNSVRSYPFHFSATLTNSAGKTLPENLLVDVHVRFSGESNSKLFLSHVLLTDDVVSVAFSRTQPDVKTVATFTAARDSVIPGETYSLVPTEFGDSGVVVFGDLSDIENDYWRFDFENQTGLMRSTFMAMYRPPKGRFGFVGTAELLDFVGLRGGGDLRIEEKVYPINGVPTRCIAIGLVDDLEDNGRDVLAEYAGNCGKRPESGTCDDPQPIERINDVRPDCCGRVFVEFRGCVSMIPVANHCGVVINCDTSVDEICGVSYKVPTENGILPFEFPDRTPDTEGGDLSICEIDECDTQLFYFSSQGAGSIYSPTSTTS